MIDETDVLGRVATVPLVIPIGKELVPCAKLNQRDIAAAASWLRGRRMQMLYEGRQIPLNDFSKPLHASVLSAILTAKFDIWDVVADPEGRLKVLELALNRAGTKITYEQLGETIAPMSDMDVFLLVAKASGLLKEKDGTDDSSDPFPTPGTTT